LPLPQVPNFPECLRQQTIRVNEVVGTVISVEKGGKQIILESLGGGARRKYSVPHLVSRVSLSSKNA
jgi:hypothetical protein